jgi:DNA-binding NarL/FixJ family response regulator
VTERARILVAEHNAPLRAGVRDALERGGFEVCAEAATAEEAVAAALRHRPDICLLDASVPGSAIDAARAITQKLPATYVVLLVGSRDNGDPFSALRAGVVGYVPKEIESARLREALERVVAGEVVLPGWVVARLVDEFREQTEKHQLSAAVGRPATLTDREWEVLLMLRDGLSTAEIANRLYVAPVTVRTHVASILRKLRVPDRAAAVDFVAR